MRALIYFLLALGSTLVLAAFFLSGGSILRSFWALILSGKILESWLIVVALFSAIIHWVRYSTKEWRGDRNIQHNYRSESDVVATLTPQLNGEFTPYVIEAAEALGELHLLPAPW